MSKPGVIIGLTGGIASGKSSVAKFMRDAGIPVLDADELTRKLSAKGGLAEVAVSAAFPGLSKSELRALVFRDASAREKLESILHPLIRKESTHILEELRTLHPLVIYEASLLIETGRESDFDALLSIVSVAADQKARALERAKLAGSSLDGETVEGILLAQTTNDQRVAKSRYVIENTGSIGELKQKTTLLLKEWKKIYGY